MEKKTENNAEEKHGKQKLKDEEADLVASRGDFEREMLLNAAGMFELVSVA